MVRNLRQISDAHRIASLVWRGVAVNWRGWRKRFTLRKLLHPEKICREGGFPEVAGTGLRSGHVVDEFEASGMSKYRLANWIFATFLLAIMAHRSPHAVAQTSAEELLKRIEAHRQLPGSDWNLDETAARGEYAAAWNDFKNYLDASGPSIRAGWEAYLEWRNLELLANPNVKLSDDVLERLRRQFRQNAAGFEYQPFARVRAALDRLAGVAMRTETADMKAAYGAKIDELIAAMKAQNAKREEITRMDAITALDWLGRTRLAPGLVEQVLARHRQPNLIITVTSGMTRHAIQEPVDDTQPVVDVILGTQICGTARTTGTVTICPAPCAGAGQLNILMNAIACSSNVGYNGPATIHSRGATSILATRPLYITQNGLTAGASSAQCSTSTVIDDIQTRSRLINKIAWKKAGKSKSEAEAIASDHAETRVERSFDERTQKLIDEANANFRDKFLTPLARFDSHPEAFDFSSDASALRISARVAKPWHFAADAPPPASQECDVVVRLHDTFVGNASENALGGFTLTDEKLAEMMLEYTGNVPEELQITQDKDPWSITFATYQPFGMEVAGNQVRIVVRGKRFSRGERVIRNTVDISATYLVEKTAVGTRLIRQGDVAVDFPKQRGTLNTAQVAFRGFLRKKFENLFKQEFVSEGLQPKGKFARIGRLQIAQITAENGWLVLGWNRAPSLPGAAAAPQSVAARSQSVVR
jgi:hypothetical protein